MKVKGMSVDRSSKLEARLGGLEKGGRLEGRLGGVEKGGRLEGRLGGVEKVHKLESRLGGRNFDLRDKLKKSEVDNTQVVFVQPKDLSAASVELEADPAVLERRNKEIQYGKNTQDYMTYREHVSKSERNIRMPRTPDKYIKMGRRKWDGQVKSWKLAIHRVAEEFRGQGVRAEEEDGENWKTEELVSTSWCEEIEEEERIQSEIFRSRASSSTSSDQGIVCDSSVPDTPQTLSGCLSPAETVDIGKQQPLIDWNVILSGLPSDPQDYIDE